MMYNRLQSNDILDEFLGRWALGNTALSSVRGKDSDL